MIVDFWIGILMWGVLCLISLVLLPITIIPAIFSMRVRAIVVTPFIAFLMMCQ